MYLNGVAIICLLQDVLVEVFCSKHFFEKFISVYAKFRDIVSHFRFVVLPEDA